MDYLDMIEFDIIDEVIVESVSVPLSLHLEESISMEVPESNMEDTPDKEVIVEVIEKPRNVRKKTAGQTYAICEICGK